MREWGLTLERLVVSFCEEQHRLGRPLWRFQQSLAIGVLAQTRQQQPVRVRQLWQQSFACGGFVVQLQVMVVQALFVACK